MAYLSSLSPSCGLSLYFHNMSFINCSCWPWSTCSTTVAQWTNIGLSFLRTFYIVVLTVCSMFEGSNRFTLLPQNQKGSALPPQTAPPTAPFKTANAIFTGEIQDLKQQGNSKLFRICPSFWGTKTCLLYPPQFCLTSTKQRCKNRVINYLKNTEFNWNTILLEYCFITGFFLNPQISFVKQEKLTSLALFHRE